jgi:serine/threonine protein phosphatase PrpC
VRTALLRGQDHTELGAIGLVSEGPAAIAICKGGAMKTYSHLDPNEDAACFAIGDGGMLVAVADGHDGASGAEAALRALLEECAANWVGERSPASSPEQWTEVAGRALSTLNSAVLRDGDERQGDAAPTTLSLALVRPREGLLYHASIGDSHVFQHRERATELGWASRERKRAYFLGYESQGSDGMLEKSQIGCETLEGVSAVVLATDGLSERAIGFDDPAGAVTEVVASALRSEPPELRAAEVSRGITEATIAVHKRNRAGDNIASAVLWLG